MLRPRSQFSFHLHFTLMQLFQFEEEKKHTILMVTVHGLNAHILPFHHSFGLFFLYTCVFTATNEEKTNTFDETKHEWGKK